jgi:hypothetical protein
MIFNLTIRCKNIADLKKSVTELLRGELHTNACGEVFDNDSFYDYFFGETNDVYAEDYSVPESVD